MSATPQQARLVRDSMTLDPITLSPGAHLSDALQTMRKHNIRHLPVVSGGKLLGLLTERDVYRSAPSVLETSLSKTGSVFERVQVETAMTREVTTVSPEAPLADAIALLREGTRDCLLVVENDCLVGILTATDFRRHPRFPFQSPVACEMGGATTPMVAVNISHAGILVTGSKLLPVGSRVKLRFSLGAAEEIEVEGVVRHIVSGCAVEFVDILPGRQARLNAYLDDIEEASARAKLLDNAG